MSGIASTCPVEGAEDAACPLGAALGAGRLGEALSGWAFSGLIGAFGALGLGDASAMEEVDDAYTALTFSLSVLGHCSWIVSNPRNPAFSTSCILTACTQQRKSYQLHPKISHVHAESWAAADDVADA